MELKKIKDLMTAMSRSGIKKLRLKEDNFEIELEKECKHKEHHNPSHVSVVPSNIVSTPVHADIPPSLQPLTEQKKAQSQNGQFITSPMVGTFYVSSGPDENPFAKVGDRVTRDSVVCIVEAMKVVNEVKATAEGQILEVLVENGHPVEFGTKLFKLG